MTPPLVAMKILILLCLSGGLLSGCSSMKYRNPYADVNPDSDLLLKAAKGSDAPPEATQLPASGTPPKMRGERTPPAATAAMSAEDFLLEKAGDEGGLILPDGWDTLNGLKAKSLAYRNFYGKMAKSFNKAEVNADEFSYYLKLAAMGAGIAEEIDWAVGLTSGAFVVDTVTDRYKILSQASNFERASEIYDALLQRMSVYEHELLPGRGGAKEINSILESVRMDLNKNRGEIGILRADFDTLKTNYEDVVNKAEGKDEAQNELDKANIAKAEKAELSAAAQQARAEAAAEAELKAKIAAEKLLISELRALVSW